MFDISFMELLVIAMVALIVIGPERLPAVARTLGHLYGRCRNFAYRVKIDIHNEMRMEELKKMHTEVQETAQSIEESVQQGVQQLKTSIDDAGAEIEQSAGLAQTQLQRQNPALKPEEGLAASPPQAEKK
ncbi:MAG: Sec-independent protein translocase protein TatB [Nitrosomonas sp.]|nr:MAG: Sec-independent protein translocase protein TatB [Nitrosomonas sp.]